MNQDISPDILLRAYSIGLFPMAEARDADQLHWMQPRLRGVLELDGFHISRSLRKRILRSDYIITVNQDFTGVMQGCAARGTTWINDQIFDLYGKLFQMGAAHSLEVWRDKALIGGVYGVAVGGVFCGESMFSRATDASKIALAYLVHRLRAGGFTLLDTQYLTPHLASLGGIEITRAAYEARLASALPLQATFTPQGYWAAPSSVAAP